MPDEQQYGYDQAAPGGQQAEQDEDVEIDWEYAAEEGLQCSMDDLTSVGYEPPTDEDSANYVA
jgi:hypothetical protein